MELWLHDLVRGGLAQVQNRPADYWQQAASRLVDAQAPGLAGKVRALADIPGSAADWPERLLIAISEIHLLIQAYKQFDALDSGIQADAKFAVGWTLTPEGLAPEPQVQDRWLIVGVRQERRERVTYRRTYLMGTANQRLALLNESRQGRQRFEAQYQVGQALQAELVYFPSNDPLRAIVTARESMAPADPLDSTLGQNNLHEALAVFGRALSRNPWQHYYCLLLNDVRFVRHQNEWFLVDERGEWLAVHPKFNEGWRLLAFSGGHPLTVAVEWDGDLSWPLSAHLDGRWVDLQPKKRRQ